ncbi:MAG: hybrid sensor histidine kinase/response regulator [Deltaproteobacteria bacterium]|nr:hybrid sensor histidine kinase/response regulator [Deltaproteobacteria bacterium]
MLVEDSAADAELILTELRRRGYAPESQRVDTEPAFGAALGQGWDCILSDYQMPGFGGLAALRLLQESGLDLPFIVVSGAIGEETAVAAMRAGAHDYIMKDSLARLGPAIERELNEAQIRRERLRVANALEADRSVADALGRLGQELIAALNSEAFLERLCQVITEVLSCDFSDTILYEPEHRIYHAVATHGHPPETTAVLRTLRIPADTTAEIYSRLQQARTALPINFGRTVTSPAAQLMQRLGITQSLFIPLRRGTELIGFQVAGYLGRVGPFTATQQRIADGVGQLASMALEHARTVQELERANRLKSEFVATMSHELRTPLNIIMGYNDLLIEGAFGPLSAEQVEPMQQLARNARSLHALVSATLDLSRLEQEQIPLQYADVQLTEILSSVDAENPEWREKPGLRLIWDVPPSLPQLQTDPLMLKVVLSNLVSNAVKFTDVGSVTVRAVAIDDGVEISVADTGIGIAPEHHATIFEPFRCIEAHATGRYGGIGLGLYLVRRILAALGGTIALESDVGCGATFTIRIPCGLAPAANARKGLASRKRTAADTPPIRLVR